MPCPDGQGPPPPPVLELPVVLASDGCEGRKKVYSSEFVLTIEKVPLYAAGDTPAMVTMFPVLKP